MSVAFLEGNRQATSILKLKKPAGWQVSGAWWTKSSAKGLMYMCPQCGKKSLGLLWGAEGKRMHTSSCVAIAY